MTKLTNSGLTEDGVITQEALLAYAEGRLSDAERAEMDRLLHEDPFAQDALEGLRKSTKPGEIHTVISSINTRLREKTGLRERKKKGIEIHWSNYAYAAVVLVVLLGVGFAMIHLLSGRHTDDTIDQPKAQESVPVTENRKNDTLQADTSKAAALAEKKDSTSAKLQALTGSQAPADTGRKKLTGQSVSPPPSAASSAMPQTASAASPEVAARVDAANKLFEASDYLNAEKKYNEVLASQPDNSDALYFGGVCYFINGTHDLGESNFDKLIKTGQYADGAKWYKAVILIKKGKKEEAKLLLKDLSSYDNYFKERAVKEYQDIYGK